MCPSFRNRKKNNGGDSSCDKPIRPSKDTLFSLENFLRNLYTLKSRPYLVHPNNYECRCASCHRKFSLNGLTQLGIAACSMCAYHNILEPAPAGYKFIRYSRCSHVELMEEGKSPEACLTCGLSSTDFSVEEAFRRPQPKRITEEKQALLLEMKRHPHRVLPELFECRCVWEGCLKFFTPYNCDDGTSQCSNCFKQVPVEFGEPGYSWLFYNRCSHVHSLPTGEFPRNCPTCGIESAPRPSGIAAPRRKRQPMELPTDPLSC